MEDSRRVKLTKKMMKDALLEIMETKPLSRISVTAVCETADVNRSTFYAHYKEPSDILEDIENDVYEQMPDFTDIKNIRSSNDLIEKDTAFFDYIRKNHRIFRILMLNPENHGFIEKITEKVLEKYDLNDGSKDERYNSFKRLYIANGAVGMLKEWISLDFPFSSEEFVKLLFDIANG